MRSLRRILAILAVLILLSLLLAGWYLHTAFQPEEVREKVVAWLGEIVPADLEVEVGSAAFSLGPGEVSEVIRLESAFYIVRVEESIDARTKPIEEVRNDVADSIYQEKMSEQMERYLRTLRERAIVDVKL